MSKPIGKVTGWYGGYPVIEPIDGWIPAVGTVLYSAPDSLTAAAPDLLDAIQDLLNQFEQRGIFVDPQHPDRIAVNKARAAIVKARGES